MSSVVGGPLEWDGSQDDDGHREYRIVWMVKGDKTEGPANALRAAGLPTPGSSWNFLGDSDPWAFCKLKMSAKEEKKEGPNRFFRIEQKFSTKGDTKWCKDEKIEDPLLQPQKVSGGFTKGKEQGILDRFAIPILTSSHEQIEGPRNEWDDGVPTVKIEQNVARLDLYLLTQMVDTVNKFQLWGLPPRTIKLDMIEWERLFYGTCGVYYKRTFTFGCKFKARVGVDSEQVGTSTFMEPVYFDRFETHDRDIADIGSKVLNGHWNRKTGHWILDNIDGQPPDPNNPRHFIRFEDLKGHITKVVLDGGGTPAGAIVGSSSSSAFGPNEIRVEKYSQSDMLLLGVPVLIEV